MTVHSKTARRLAVCLEHFCQRCEVAKKEYPKDCPYLILHLLDDGPVPGVMSQRPRQSGKTHELTTLANLLAENGYPVIYLVTNHHMGGFVQRNLRNDVKVMTYWSVKDHGRMRGVRSSFVLLDEVRPEMLAQIEDSLRFHQIVAGYWT